MSVDATLFPAPLDSAERAPAARPHCDRDLADAQSAWSTLAPLMAARGRMRVSRDGGRNYRARDERSVTTTLPNQPAAVLTYDHAGSAHVISLDFDSSRGGPQGVARDVASLTRLLDRLRLRWFSDTSPNGGRHVYVPLREPAPFHEASMVVRGLSARMPTLDPLPMLNVRAGCIRVPGSRHRSGGFQVLDQPLSHAVTTLQHGATLSAWESLLAEVAPNQATAAPQPGATTAGASPLGSADADPDVRLTPLPGHDRPSGEVLAIARHGDWSADKYRSASEARQAVVWAAVASGWAFGDVARRIEDGTWPGLASLYARYSRAHRRSALVRDWRRAVAFESERRSKRQATPERDRSVRLRTTSPQKSQAGGGEGANREVRVWLAAVDLLCRGQDPATKAVLYALGEAAALTGSLVVEHGNRSLAIATGLDQSTVGRVLRGLRAAPTDRLLIDLVRPAEGVRAHAYALLVPPLLRAACEKKPWRRGKVHAIRPVFRELGLPAAFVYAALEQAREPLSGRALAPEAGLGHTATYEALDVLAAWGLADRVDGGWVRGAASLEALAERLGCDERVAAQILRYRAERRAWWIFLGLLEVPDDIPDDIREDPGSVAAPPPPPSPPPTAPASPHLRLVPTERERTRDEAALACLVDVLGAVVIG